MATHTQDTDDTGASESVSDPLLRTEGLTKRFGTLTAVDDLSLSIEEGDITAVIGPNGAGKTTLFNTLTGKYEPSEGEVRFRGERIDGLAPHDIVGRGIARSYQITNFFPELSARENVRLGVYAQHAGFGRSDLLSHFTQQEDHLAEADDILDRIGLSEVATEQAASLSHGQQRHLEVGIALAADPDLLLLDEPTAGMSPGETGEAVDLITELNRDTTIVIIEHNMEMITDISDRIAVMHHGSLLAMGSPADISADERVQEAYLGEDRR
ncbi:ABC transporter ATP-binding protein [Halorarius halobius]|uniref:ABC transporter ATP-binding protein n=1 Tax=Halorarius halobius TaxID=2962671 RepID=UPI0020CC5C58|nr:ABC transporter ATP-binding protein [Halorarius halobius]